MNEPQDPKRNANGNGEGCVTDGKTPRFKVVERDGGFWIDDRQLDFMQVRRYWSNNPKVLKTPSEYFAAIKERLRLRPGCSIELERRLHFVTGKTITKENDHWRFHLHRCGCGSLFIGHGAAMACPDCAAQAALEAKDRQREEVAKRNNERAAIRKEKRLDQRCVHCNEPLIERQRSRIGYCSSKCRQAAYRERHASPEVA
jgi:hypothetical protein